MDATAPRAFRWPTSVLTIAIISAIYLPNLGAFGLYDCWETYYTEVSRQYLETNDWLTPRWHNGDGPDGHEERYFWSKPAGTFWLSGFTLKLLGLQSAMTHRATSAKTDGDTEQDPGQFIAASPVEWAIRLPLFLCGLFGAVCLYFFAARVFSKAVGVLAALILATSPLYFFISRQAMTDIPYVGLMSGGIALFALAMFGNHTPLERFSPFRFATRTGSLPKATGFWVFIFIAICFQALQMAAIVPPLWSTPLAVSPFESRRLSLAIWMLPYVILFGAFLVSALRTTTHRETLLFAFYFCTAFAGLSKSLVGLLQPGLVIFVYLLVSQDWQMLKHVALGRGILLVLCIAGPWYHAMAVRYGWPWYNELFGVHQFQRLAVGELKHAKGTFDYYISQLLYGMFPWIAFLPSAAILFLDSEGDELSQNQHKALTFILVWAISSVLFFSIASTKYHHYILPALPPLALLTALGMRQLFKRGIHYRLIASIATLIVAATTLELARQPAHWAWLYTYLYTQVWSKGFEPVHRYLFLGFGGVLCIVIMVSFAERLRRSAIVAFIALGILIGGFTLSYYQQTAADIWSQKSIIQSYYRKRTDPQQRLVAWQFHWRGETFYTAADVVVAKSLDNRPIQKWLRNHQGTRFFFITERHRFGSLRNMLPTPRAKSTLRVEDDQSVHFILASAEI